MTDLINDLLKQWEEQLVRFRATHNIAKNLDERTSLGIQHARIITLESCIRELRGLV